jgi:type I restriction enzyme S subunit
MEVMPGYKQTEVGVIPADWAVIPMAELFTFRNGVNADKAAYGKGIPFINVLEVITHSTLTEARIPGRISLPPQTSSAFIVQTGDVLFNRTSETQEEVGLASVYVDNREVVFGGFVIRARPRNGSLNPMFSSYALRSPSIRQQIVSRGQGAVRANIGQQDLSKVQVLVPPLPEQEAIAEVLSKADALIENLERLIAKKRILKKGVAQELLTGKQRLRGFANATTGYKQTEVGVVPEDWEVRKLGALLADPPNYGINAPAIPYDTRYPTYLRITDISDDGRFIKESKASVKHPEAGKYILSGGDLVFARTGASVGKSYLYDPADGVLVFAGFLIRVRPDVEKLSSKFLKFYTHSRQYWNWIAVNSMRTGQPGINGQEYASLPIPLPPTQAEQEAIAEVLSAMDAEIALLGAQLAKYRQLKQGLMQKLLTGRIRLI